MEIVCYSYNWYATVRYFYASDYVREKHCFGFSPAQGYVQYPLLRVGLDRGRETEYVRALCFPILSHLGQR